MRHGCPADYFRHSSAFVDIEFFRVTRRPPRALLCPPSFFLPSTPSSRLLSRVYSAFRRISFIAIIDSEQAQQCAVRRDSATPRQFIGVQQCSGARRDAAPVLKERKAVRSPVARSAYRVI